MSLLKFDNTDYLKNLSVDELSAWYRRLADAWPSIVPSLKEPLVGKFIYTWLDNREEDKEYVFDAPEHLRYFPAVIEVLHFHRRVFLTEEKASFHPRPKRWVGLLPRIQGLPGFQKWDMLGDLSLEYESLCDPAPGFLDIARVQKYGTDAEKDITGSLRGFQLKSTCKVNVFFVKNSTADVRFKDWYVSATDRYDWDNVKHLTVLNPDYQSKAATAVKPDLQVLTVYHTNAIRLEKANKAKPFQVKIRPWQVNHSYVSPNATIDITKKLP